MHTVIIMANVLCTHVIQDDEQYVLMAIENEFQRTIMNIFDGEKVTKKRNRVAFDGYPELALQSGFRNAAMEEATILIAHEMQRRREEESESESESSDEADAATEKAVAVAAAAAAAERRGPMGSSESTSLTLMEEEELLSGSDKTKK